MAVTYADKVSIKNNDLPEANQWTAANANEVKDEINKLAQGNDQTILSNTNALETVETYFCDASGGAFNLTLPAAPKDGKIYQVKKIDASANAITVKVSGGVKKIDFSLTQTLNSQGTNLTIRYYESKSQYYIL